MAMRSFQQLKTLAGQAGDGLPELNMFLVGDSATQFLATAIRGMGRERGFRVNLQEADYDQVEHQLQSPDSDLFRSGADFILIFQSSRKAALRHSRMTVQQQASFAEDRIAFLSSVCSNPALASRHIICFNYPEMDDGVYGNYANKQPSSFPWQLRKLNLGLMELSREHPNLFICDLSSIQNQLGREKLFAPNLYVNADLTLGLDALPLVSSRLMDIVCAIRGQVRKCLILDLDNTLWGGVIGDDGMEGIQIGHGIGIGKAYTEIQLWARKLKQRGIILCVASKNNEQAAREPFLRHPDMVLSLDDFAVFLANWETKVDNIHTIQRILNIGFDSMVFLDDSPFEREMVREAIPQIAVPELPANPENWLEYLSALNLFETASSSEADQDRTRQYQEQAQRTVFAKTFSNEEDYLRSLGMTSRVEGLTPFNIPRVAQLSQRSNQFNLRTVRYTDAELQALAKDKQVIPLTFTLEDRFGDNGLIAVVILRALNADSLFIENWWMSCRVLKRGMEAFTLNALVENAAKAGYRYLVGEYLPTAKNQIVAGLYAGLGFRQDGDRWILAVCGYTPGTCFIEKQ